MVPGISFLKDFLGSYLGLTYGTAGRERGSLPSPMNCADPLSASGRAVFNIHGKGGWGQEGGRPHKWAD